VDTTGKFVLSVDNAGVVHVFAIASATGNVSEIGRSDPGGFNAGGIAMDPGGHFVFVSAAANPNATGATNQITVFTFDPTTGAMKKLQSYPQPNPPGPAVVIAR
jgi:6-phosphogluconolactonase (cycloisomerase 2 family)